MDPLGVQIIGLIGGLTTAGLAIAAQKVVTSLAGYLVIRRSHIFHRGDRIKMGGAHGDVIALGLLQTRILEIGQPHEVNQQEEPGMWVRARQFSGRIVIVTNDKVFDEPVYNFTRDFPFIWEELVLPIPYKADRARAEHILLDAAIEATGTVSEQARSAIRAFNERYGVLMDQPDPRVFWRLTDNWVEMTVRFIVAEHGIRDIKDRMARQIVGQLADAGIDVASTTLDITGVPPLKVERHVSVARNR